MSKEIVSTTASTGVYVCHQRRIYHGHFSDLSQIKNTRKTRNVGFIIDLIGKACSSTSTIVHYVLASGVECARRTSARVVLARLAIPTYVLVHSFVDFVLVFYQHPKNTTVDGSYKCPAARVPSDSYTAA